MKTIKSSRMAPLPMPIEIQLQPTNRCNANCLFCWFHDSKQDFVELPDEVWLGLTDEICALGIPKVTFCGGGEPLLRAQLVLQMMETFSKAGIDGALITNGMLITEHFAKRMVELQWPSVQVSIHAPTAQLNDAIMGRKGAFSLALRGIGNLNKYKHLLKSTLPELDMRIVVTQSNVSTLSEFIRLAHSQGVSRVFIRGDNREGITIPKRDMLFLKGALERANKVADELEQRIELEFDTQQLSLQEAAYSGTRISQDEPQEKTPESADRGVLNWHCPIPFCELVIFANGSTSPCCNFFGMQFKSEEQRAGWLEDLTHKSLTQVWRGGFAALRSSMSSKGGLCQICMSCSMDMKHWKGQGPEFFFHRKFEHHRKQKRYREGIRYGLEQLKEYPDNPTLSRYIGEFYMEEGEYNAAIGVMEQLENCGKDFEGLHFLLGRCHFEIGEYKKALKRFEENFFNSTIPESHPRTWHYMTLCHLKLRHYDKMKHCLNKAKEFVKGKGEHSGEKQLREFVEQWPTPFFHEEFKQLKDHKKYTGGLEFGQQQLKEYPDNAVLHHHIGEFHMELGEYDKAIERLSRAVQLDPKMEWTHFSLGKCFYLTGRHCEAEKAFRRNLELTSDRLSHFHSWLFLAMAADARNDGRGCRKALQSLKDFKDFLGNEIPLEGEFITRLEKKRMLPAWFRTASRGKKVFKTASQKSEMGDS